MDSYKRLLFLSIFILTILTINVHAVTKFSLSGQTSYTLSWGGSDSATITISCLNSYYNCNCQKSINSGAYSNVGVVTAGSSINTYVPISAPSSGQGTTPYQVMVACNDAFDSTFQYQSMTINVNYPTAAQWAAYQAQQQAKSQASSDISAAQSLISQAQSSYNDAQNKIKEASNLGADIGSTQQYLNSADADLSSANSLMSQAQSSFNSGDYQTASNYANQAQQKANTVKSNAGLAKSTATSIIEEWNRLKTAAQNKISDSNSAIDTAKQRIQIGESVIYNATILGLDTVQAKAQIATARTKVDSATAYYQEASSMFKAATNKESFEGAKSKAQSAIDIAKEAEQLATSAYSSLAATLAVAGESSKAILNANSEVSQMNEIMTKLDYVIISTEKYGVNLADTKNVATSSKTSVDSAEDLLSQAKNRQASGSFNEAVSLANRARDEAAKSRNRLDTISQTMSLSAQKALDDAFEKTKSKIAEAESEVGSAASTYGATATLIVSAQSSLTDAKKSLEEVKSHIDKVKTASGLSDLVKELDAAFKAVDETNKKITDSINDAKSAKLGLVKKVAGVGAGVAGAAGGGFLYYRWRKKKKGEKSKEKEHAEKKTKHGKEDKEHKEKKSKKILSLFSKAKCPECGHKIKKNQKFCPQCGKKAGD